MIGAGSIAASLGITESDAASELVVSLFAVDVSAFELEVAAVLDGEDTESSESSLLHAVRANEQMRPALMVNTVILTGIFLGCYPPDRFQDKLSSLDSLESGDALGFYAHAGEVTHGARQVVLARNQHDLLVGDQTSNGLGVLDGVARPLIANDGVEHQACAQHGLHGLRLGGATALRLAAGHDDAISRMQAHERCRTVQPLVKHCRRYAIRVETCPEDHDGCSRKSRVVCRHEIGSRR